MAGIADAFDEPLARGYAMVGRFLQEWSFMEHELRNAIGKALGLTLVQSVWVCANISFRDKINILKTAIDVAYIFPKEDKAPLKKTLDDISSHAAIRNMVAHDSFSISDDGSEVSFFVVRAKGKFSLPETKWGRERFNEEYKTLQAWASDIKAMAGRLQTSDLAHALMSAKPGVPTGGLFALGFSNPLSRLPEESQHSNPVPSNEGTTSQTRPKLTD